MLLGLSSAKHLAGSSLLWLTSAMLLPSSLGSDDPAVLTLLSRAEPVSGREPVLPRCPLFRFHIGEYPGTRKRMKASKFPPTAPSLERESELLCESAPKLHDSREPV